MARTDSLIVEAFVDQGWLAERRPFEVRDGEGYLDLGTLRDGQWGPTRYPNLAGVNVVAVMEGTRDREAVVLLAHHDTPRDLPGADDNAAGVAVLVELARLLGRQPLPKAVVLAAADMEEIGLFGSRALVEELARERGVVAAITFDTIAYTTGEPGSQILPPGLGILYPRLAARLRRRGMRGDWTAILYRGFSDHVARAVARPLAEAIGPELVECVRDPGDLPVLGPILRATLPMVRQFARSDHLSFWNAGIPAVVVTDTTFFRSPHYHELTDVPDTIDYRRLAAITDATLAAVRELAGS